MRKRAGYAPGSDDREGGCASCAPRASGRRPYRAPDFAAAAAAARSARSAAARPGFMT